MFDFDKVFPAFLLAAVIAMMSGFFAKKIVHPEKLKEDAVQIDGAAVAATAVKKVQKAEPILHLMAAADVARGEQLSRACAACHSFDQGGINKVGPNLWDFVNNPKGTKDGYAYSEALLAFGGQWGYVELNQFLWKPKTYMPGTKMAYVGMKKPEDRAAMVKWLASLSSSPAGLPSDADIAAEKALLVVEEPEPAEAAE